jgi:hypothetical protein
VAPLPGITADIGHRGNSSLCPRLSYPEPSRKGLSPLAPTPRLEGPILRGVPFLAEPGLPSFCSGEMLKESQVYPLIAIFVGGLLGWGVSYAWPGLPWFAYVLVAIMVAGFLHSLLIATASLGHTIDKTEK